jgi:ABC-type multidrug transport system ATPase subunit
MKQRFGIAAALIGRPSLLIVDEPTAGLDPTERRRFLNLLGAIGRDVIVILSTHIIDDVEELCPRMAIIDTGTVRFEGSPEDAVRALDGRIWAKTIEAGDLPAYEARHRVVSSSLVAGRTVVRISSETRPEYGFEPATPTLEDVYFLTLTDRRRA